MKNLRAFWGIIFSALGLLGAATLEAQTLAQTFFVPVPGTQSRTWAQAIQVLPENEEMHSVISITVTSDGTIVYFDHWEDGFEADITSPTLATSEIWGDQDCSNGYSPLLVSCTSPADDPLDFLTSGPLVLEDDVPVPGGVRDPALILFDGGDKFAATGLLAVTRAAWPSTGVQAQLGGAVEVFATSSWGTAFEAPVGENAGPAAFEFVAAAIMAEEDGTLVEVDADADGTPDLTQTLAQGESLLAPDLLVGAGITASAGVQIDLLTANEATNYEGRWYSLVPRADWTGLYFSPVGSTVVGDLVHLYLYNPGPAGITVAFEQQSGCTDVPVGSGAEVEVAIDVTTPISAARLSSDGRALTPGLDCTGDAATGGDFFAVATIDRNETIHDWGFSLIPESSLTPSAVVGWAPGSTDLSENASPVWVTAVLPPGGTTTVYVDLDGDPTMGGSLTDPFGNLYDVDFTAGFLESIRIFDGGPGSPCGTGDCDQTGLRAYTTDGTRLAAAWGQDPEYSSSGQSQQLDMGTTVLPFSSLAAFKDGALTGDANGNGVLDPGETILYTIRVVNNGIIPIADIDLRDTNDPNVTYVPDSTKIDGLGIADDASPATAFPLDGDPDPDGYPLVMAPDLLDPGQEIVVTYEVVVNDPLAVEVFNIVNNVVISSASEIFIDSETNPVPRGELELRKTSSAIGADVTPGQAITYTVEVRNIGQGPLSGITLTDPLPAGAAYAAGSTSVTGPQQLFVADSFETVSFANNNGPSDWEASWVENDPEAGGAGPATGQVQIIGGRLRLDDAPDTGGQPSAAREVDLSGGLAYAFLRFDFATDTGVDSTDAVTLEASSTGTAGPWTQLRIFSEISGALSGTRAFDLSGFLSADTALRFRVSNSYEGANEFFFVDELNLAAFGGSDFFRDEFGSVSYANQDGSPSFLWATDWLEIGEGDGAGSGDIAIVDDPDLAGIQSVLRLRDNDNGGEGVEREADLSALAGEVVILTFDYRRSDLDAVSDYATLDISPNGGSTWTELDRFTGEFSSDDANYVRTGYDISAFVAANTRLRFLGSPDLGGNDEIYFDNVDVRVGRRQSVTKDNSGGGNPQLLDGTPAGLVLAHDDFALAPGDVLTTTFQVTAQDPLALSSIVNTATATSFENPTPVSDTVVDSVATGGAIGDLVWLDVDGDGVFDIGEPGIANVVVELRDGVCAPGSCPTATTDADGRYLFDDLPAGTYTVVVDETTLPVGLTASPGTGTASDPIPLAAGQRVLDVDFGYTNADPATGILGDYVWSDADGDGVQDPGEPGLPGVVMALVSDPGPDGAYGTDDDVVAATTATGPDGRYLFVGVPPGEYVVVADVGADGMPGSGDEVLAAAGYTPTAGPQSEGGFVSAPVSVAAGEVIDDVDFGFDNPALFSIRDTVWLDVDGDATLDAGERGIAGVTVNLLDAAGNVIATVVTGADGEVLFDGVANGDYTLEISDNASLLTALDATTVAAAAGTLPLTVMGADLTGVNFGYNSSAVVIGDRIWSDADGDGVQDPGESGIGGVTVRLVDVVSGLEVATATTGPDGTYVFRNLPPGSYVVEVTDSGGVLAAYAQTGDPSEPGLACSVCNDQASTTVAPGGVDLALDFGYRNATLADLSGTVFEDADADGLLEAGENGIGAVTVALLDATGNVIATTTTDASGNYSFPGLPAGDYTVQVTDREGILEGYRLTSGLDALDVTLAGDDIGGLDFGYVRGGGTASIGDRLWLDVDPDGIGAGTPNGLPDPNEPGLAGVTVDLWEDTDGDGVLSGGDTLVASTVTDANGDYVFHDLAAGFYLVDVIESTLPADLDETVYPAAVDPSAVITLSEGELYRDADFGYVPDLGTAVLGDRVWYDADSDGLQDPGEAGIEGVDILLVGGPSCTPTPCTVTTGPDGVWLATGLLPGDYAVGFDASTLPGVNTTPTNLDGDDVYNVSVVAGDVFSQLDFGFDGGVFGSIGDTIYLDVDGDGTEDPGEPGVEGVTLNLVRDTNGDGVWDPDGADNILGTADDEPVTATTTSDAAGSYDFVGLAPADYLVLVTDIDAVLDGLNVTQAPALPITITFGEDVDTADFGYAPSGGSGEIGNFVWHDLDGDGLVDAGEPGIEGVTVRLWLDDGDGIFEPFTGDDNLLRSATTDRNGEYELLGLPPATYWVTVSDTAGVLMGFVKTIGPDQGADDNSKLEPYRVDLAAGASDVTADFGYQADTGPPGIFSIAGTVFEDTDRSGDLNSGEDLVAGARLLLYRDLDGDGVLDPGEPLIGATASDVNGDYLFGDLPPGTYLVEADSTGTTADGFQQTTQIATAGLQPVILGPDSIDKDFGFWDGGIVSTPVTLAFFSSEGGGTVRFRWMTAIEVGHLGFNLYVLQDEALGRLNQELIAGRGGDSIEPREYVFEAFGVEGDLFLLEDVDIFGEVRFHGPFELGQSYGRDDLEPQAVDWPAIRRERDGRRQARLAARRGPVAAGIGAGPGRPAGARLLVPADGVYRLTYEQLLAAGIDFGGIPARQLALLQTGKPVPIRIGGRALFGSGSWVEFVGHGLDTLYTRTNIYRLEVAPRHAERVVPDERKPSPWAEVPEFFLDSSAVEQERAYHYAAPGDDPWYDARLLATSGPVEITVALELDAWFPGAAPVELEVGLWGVTDFPQAPDHHAVIDVNGLEVADEWFDGLVDVEVSATLPDSALQPDGNLLRVTLPHDTGAPYDLVNYDRYRVTYPRRFEARDGRLTFTAAAEAFRVDGLPSSDVTVYRVNEDSIEHLTQVTVTGVPGAYSATFVGSPAAATYHVTAIEALRLPAAEPGRRPPPDLLTGQAELVVIAHPDFLAGIAPLVAARRAAGWSVKVVDVEDLYESLTYGVFDPVAIWDYLRRARQRLGTTHVLLVGGDTYDYHDHLGLGSVSFVPTLYARTDPIVHFAPVDTLYGDMEWDGVPELAVGRLPARTPAELATVLEKIFEYETIAYSGTAVLAADAYDLAAGYSFADASDTMRALLPTDWQVESAYIDDLGLADAHQLLVGAINQGVALTSYFGHSGLTVWSFQGLFDTVDADGLQNSGLPTVVTQWGCWNTYHVAPRYHTLGHRLLLGSDRGAAAVLGAATLTGAASERKLGQRVFARLGQPGVTLGEAILEAKRDLAQTDPELLDVLLGWTLLGDPTLEIQP